VKGTRAHAEANFDSSRAWSSLIVVIVGTFLSAISATTVSVALPTIMNVFSASLDDVQWITTAYTLTMAIVIPLTPYLSHVFCSERVYLVALIVFSVFSVACAFSWSLNVMIVFRVLQALGGGMMMPIGMGMVISLFPPSKRGVAFGVFGVAAMAAPAFGPTLGGYIVEYFGWDYIFFLNVPLGLLSVLLALRFFTFSPRKPFPRFDIAGFVSATIGSSLLLYLLGRNEKIDWHDPSYVYMAILGAGAFVFFVVNEWYARRPLLDLRILRDRNFSLSLLMTIAQMAMMMSVAYTMPVFLQSFKGLTAMQSGAVLLPSSLVMALFMPIAGRISDMAGERGTKWIIGLGIVITEACTFWISTLFSVNASLTMLIIASSIRNIGLGISMMPARTLGLINIHTPEASQKATAMSSFIQQYSSSLSIATVTMLITSRLNATYAQATAQLTPFNVPLTQTISQMTQGFVAQGMSAADATTQALQQIVKGIYIDNYVLAIQHTIFTLAVAGVVALIFVPLFKTHKLAKNRG